MPNLTQSDVNYLLAARKFVFRTIRDNTKWEQKKEPKPDELVLVFEIRRCDNPTKDVRLRFIARKELDKPNRRWGVSLQYMGVRVRGIDHKLREDNIKNGLIAGFIRHWHEHVLNEIDG